MVREEFIKKIIKAKKLEYEAIKEILPDSARRRLDSLESETINLFKDIAIELMEDEIKEKSHEEIEKKIKKVSIQ